MYSLFYAFHSRGACITHFLLNYFHILFPHNQLSTLPFCYLCTESQAKIFAFAHVNPLLLINPYFAALKIKLSIFCFAKLYPVYARTAAGPKVYYDVCHYFIRNEKKA